MQKENKAAGIMLLPAVWIILLAGMLIAGGYKTADTPIEELQQLTLSGKYSVDGSTWQILTSSSRLDFEEVHSVVIMGNFSHACAVNTNIILWLENLDMKIQINGETCFECTHPGNTWTGFRSPGITTSDEITISLQNPYPDENPAAAAHFISMICNGSWKKLLRTSFACYGHLVIIGAVVIILGVIQTVAAAVSWIKWKAASGRLLCGALFSLTSGIWLCMEYHVASLLFPVSGRLESIDIFCRYMMPAVLLMYLTSFIRHSGRYLVVFCSSILPLAAVCSKVGEWSGGPTSLAAWNDYGRFYVRAALVIGVGCLVLQFVRTPEKRLKYELMSLLLLLSGTVVAGLFPLQQQYTRKLVLGHFMLVYAILQIIKILVVFIREQQQGMQRQMNENAVIRSRVDVTISQLQPHFLYNCLTAIYALCDIDTEQAKTAVVNFSAYLRSNFHGLADESKLISFDEEMTHIKNYLALEKMRFDDELQIVYDLRAEDFEVPPTTIQAIVENAVHHGVSQKEDGGTVTIRSWEDKEAFIVCVLDDGVGIETEKFPEDGKTHRGIEHVRKRIELSCHGTVAIVSLKGKGTTVTISIPKNK